MPDTRSESIAGIVATMPASIWRANQMALCRMTTATTGFPALDAELPNGGWPRSSLVELLVQQHGIGEMQLLARALAPISQRRKVALIHPPHAPQAMACDPWGVRCESLIWIKTDRSADALWTAEQLLNTGDGVGALILWQSQIRAESLRRLNLAAQAADTYFWVIRPLAARPDPSPAPLRLALLPAHAGIKVEIAKRRGPCLDEQLYLALPGMPTSQVIENDHALLDRRVPATDADRSASPLLV